MVGVAAAYVVFTTPIYTARAHLLIDAKMPNLQLRENSTEPSSAGLK